MIAKKGRTVAMRGKIGIVIETAQGVVRRPDFGPGSGSGFVEGSRGNFVAQRTVGLGQTGHYGSVMEVAEVIQEASSVLTS